MRALTDEQRREAIEASPNVIGFARFSANIRMIDLADAYRSGKQEKDDGNKD
jgi:hypothetical protein